MIHFRGGRKVCKLENDGSVRIFGDAENAHPGRNWKDARFQGGRKVIICEMGKEI
ncbi:MAG: hypothetical protein IJ217_03445 [Clostridia bacterium]|nr:hypothetical protein [Clostridia bacterium]